MRNIFLSGLVLSASFLGQAALAQRYGSNEQTLSLKGKFLQQGKSVGINVDGTVIPLRGRPIAYFTCEKMDPKLIKAGMRVRFYGTVKDSTAIEASRLTVYPFPRSVAVGDSLQRSFKGLEISVSGMGTILSVNPAVIRTVNETGKRIHFTVANSPPVGAAGQLRYQDIAPGEMVTADFVTQLNTRSGGLNLQVLKSKLLNCKSIRVERQELKAEYISPAKSSSRTKRKRK